jgi:hypothetical protein
MAHAITSATPTELATATQTRPVASSAASSQKPTPSQPQSTTSIPKDTVQISTAAQTALQEAKETPTQTAQEARSGDHQAQRLLASQAAAKKA